MKTLATIFANVNHTEWICERCQESESYLESENYLESESWWDWDEKDWKSKINNNLLKWLGHLSAVVVWASARCRKWWHLWSNHFTLETLSSRLQWLVLFGLWFTAQPILHLSVRWACLSSKDSTSPSWPPLYVHCPRSIIVRQTRLLWIWCGSSLNGFDHAGEAGRPNWRELHKQRKCPAGEETSYLPQLHTFFPLVFCILNTQKNNLQL